MAAKIDKTKPNGIMIGFTAFVMLFIVIGLALLFFGIKSTFDFSTAGYDKTVGYLSDYTLYRDSHYDAARKKNVAATYTLTYTYTVDGLEYTVSSASGTSFVPAMGSERKIMYDPENPQKAVIAGMENGFFMIFMGLFFAGVPSVFFLPAVLPSKPKKKRKKKRELPFDVTCAVIGLIFISVSYGVLYMITGEYTISGIFKYYTESFIFPLVIPIIMAAGGILAVVRSFGIKKEKNKL